MCQIISALSTDLLAVEREQQVPPSGDVIAKSQTHIRVRATPTYVSTRDNLCSSLANTVFLISHKPCGEKGLRRTHRNTGRQYRRIEPILSAHEQGTHLLNALHRGVTAAVHQANWCDPAEHIEARHSLFISRFFLPHGRIGASKQPPVRV